MSDDPHDLIGATPDVMAQGAFVCRQCGQRLSLVSTSPLITAIGKCHCGTVYEVISGGDA